LTEPPKVFISYSHDSDTHKNWVLKLATDLRELGIDITLDQWDLSAGQDMAVFMENSVARAERVLLVCTEEFVNKANARRGGVGYECVISSAEILAFVDTKKFVPLLREVNKAGELPKFLGPRKYLNFSDDATYSVRIDDLAKELHGLIGTTKPPLGPNPFIATVPDSENSTRIIGPTGLLSSGRPLLSDQWFEERAADANQGIGKLNLPGALEIRFAVHDPVRKSQIELLNAVRSSEVHTFGWPIGVTLENRDEYKPRPFSDGVRAEVPIHEGKLDGGSCYDYWAARINGDFYTLQSFFEDQRTEKALFFDTRIVRITEGLMFASNFLKNLGILQSNQMSLSFVHQGLAGRTLSSASPRRHVWERTTKETKSEGLITDSVAGLRSNILEHVIKIAEPMFMLFEFAAFDRSIYEGIVNGYVDGRVT